MGDCMKLNKIETMICDFIRDNPGTSFTDIEISLSGHYRKSYIHHTLLRLKHIGAVEDSGVTGRLGQARKTAYYIKE